MAQRDRKEHGLDRGALFTEYALLLVFVLIAAFLGVMLFGAALVGQLERLNTLF